MEDSIRWGVFLNIKEKIFGGNKSAFKWIVKNSKPQTLNIIFLVICYAAFSYIGVNNALISGNLVDSAVKVANGTSKDMKEVIFYAVLFTSAIAAQIILRVLCSNLSFKAAARLEISMKNNLFRQIVGKEYKKISEYHSGELLNRLTSDISIVANCITTILPNLVFFLVQITGAFVLLCRIDIVFAALFFVGGICVLVLAQILKPIMKRMHKKCQETDGKTRSFMQEIIASLLVVKVFNSEDRVAKDCKEYQEINYKARRKRNIFSIITSTGLVSVFSIGHLFSLIWGCFRIALYNMSYGTLTSILSLVSQIQSPIQGLSSVFSTYYQALASADRIMEIEDIRNEEYINDKNLDVQKIYSELKTIEFSNITFSYDRDTILEDTGATVNKGDFVAVTGASGIGKSTLVKLLLSVFEPSKGSIYFTMKNGEKMHVDKGTRNMFAYVPQGNFLLSGTIRENISFIKPEATDEEIMRIAKLCCADEFINELPMGLNTVIGEKGKGLSEGQVQRIAVARALISDAPILLLDEATSALDQSTEERLLSNLKSLTDKTCIMISHKNAASSVCNRELHINEKKITDEK